MTPFKTNINALSVAKKQARFALRVHQSDGTSHEVSIHGSKYAVGSGPRCQLRLREPGIDPLHLLFVCDADSAIVRRWSTHTLLNGKEFNDASLEIGDRLSLGQLELEVIPSCTSPVASTDNTGGAAEEEDCAISGEQQAIEELAEPKSAAQEESEAEHLVALEAAEYVFEQLKSANQTSRGRARKLVAALRNQRQISSALEQRIQSLEWQFESIDSQTQAPFEKEACEVAGEGFATESVSIAKVSEATVGNDGPESIDVPCSTATEDEFNEDGQPVVDGEDVEGFDGNWNGAGESSEETAESSTDSDVVDDIASRLAEIQDIERELSILQDSDSVVLDEEDSSSVLEANDSEPLPEELAEDAPVDDDAADVSVEDSASAVELSGDASSLWGLGSDDGIDDELLGPNASGRPKSIALPPVEEVAEESPSPASDLPDEQASVEAEPEEELIAVEQKPEPETAPELPGAAPPEETGLSDSSLAHLRELAIWKDEPSLPTEQQEILADDEGSVEEVSELPVELNSSEVEPATPELPSPEVAAAVEPVSVESENGASADSFIERYAHMFDDDDAGDVADSEPTEAVVQPPVPAFPVSVPVADLPVEEDSEDSIDEYMAQLMQRVRGETPASDSVISVPQPVVQPAVPEPEPVAVVEESVPQTPISLEEMKKSEPLPEQATDMKALRELANHSARKAIGTHANRKRRDNATGSVIIVSIAMASSVYLLLTSPAMASPQFLGGCISLVIAVGWGVKILGSLLRAERIENAIVKGKAAPAAKPALPIDGTIEPASQSGSSINFK